MVSDGNRRAPGAWEPRDSGRVLLQCIGDIMGYGILWYHMVEYGMYLYLYLQLLHIYIYIITYIYICICICIYIYNIDRDIINFLWFICEVVSGWIAHIGGWSSIHFDWDLYTHCVWILVMGWMTIPHRASFVPGTVDQHVHYHTMYYTHHNYYYRYEKSYDWSSKYQFFTVNHRKWLMIPNVCCHQPFQDGYVLLRTDRTSFSMFKHFWSIYQFTRDVFLCSQASVNIWMKRRMKKMMMVVLMMMLLVMMTVLLMLMVMISS